MKITWIKKAIGTIIVMGVVYPGHTAATFAKKWLGKEHEL